MSDNKKNSPKGMRFEGGRPNYKGDGKNFRSDNRKNGGYGKKYNDEGSYKKNGYDKKRYDNGGYGKDGYAKKYADEGGKKGGYARKYSDEDRKSTGYMKKDNKRNYDEKRDKYNNYRQDNDYGKNRNDRYAAQKNAESGIDTRGFNEVKIREDELPFLIMGRNAVREAIKSGRSIDKILVVPERDGSLGEILGMARDRNILIQEERREKLDELCMPFGHGEKTGNHQGIVARVPGAEYVDLEDILSYAREKDEKPFILLLDGITDPYNFGSIIRSAECAGVHGIIIPKRRSATLTSSAVKVAAGAASHMRIAKVPNIASAIDRLHEHNIWVAGTDMEGESVYTTDMRGAMAIVVGSEDEGISELVRKKCDYIVSAPIKGHIDSLNAAVAAAVFIYEKVRQDMNK